MKMMVLCLILTACAAATPTEELLMAVRNGHDEQEWVGSAHVVLRYWGTETMPHCICH